MNSKKIKEKAVEYLKGESDFPFYDGEEVNKALDIAIQETAKEIFKEIEKNAMSSAVERYEEYGIWVRESVYQNIKQKFIKEVKK